MAPSFDDDDDPPPLSDKLAPMLAQRADLLARIERVENENKKLSKKLNLGAGPRLLHSPAGIAAVFLMLVLGLMGGFWYGRLELKGQSFSNGLF
jgi:hypothetical protein